MKIAIRKAVLADADAITECVQAAFQHYVERMGKLPGPMLNDYSEIIQQHATFVATDRESVVGLLVLMQKSAGLLLDNIAVDPQCQGRGVGKLLLQFAEDECRSRGYASIQMYTHECMVENVDMYQRCGWEITEYRQELGFKRVYFSKAMSDPVPDQT
ncbi:MAG: ribosomal protein S18 acetylase RimI-like enzyme [Parasphingorhabdus sp.]